MSESVDSGPALRHESCEFSTQQPSATNSTHVQLVEGSRFYVFISCALSTQSKRPMPGIQNFAHPARTTFTACLTLSSNTHLPSRGFTNNPNVDQIKLSPYISDLKQQPNQYCRVPISTFCPPHQSTSPLPPSLPSAHQPVPGREFSPLATLRSKLQNLYAKYCSEHMAPLNGKQDTLAASGESSPHQWAMGGGRRDAGTKGGGERRKSGWVRGEMGCGRRRKEKGLCLKELGRNGSCLEVEGGCLKRRLIVGGNTSVAQWEVGGGRLRMHAGRRSQDILGNMEEKRIQSCIDDTVA